MFQNSYDETLHSCRSNCPCRFSVASFTLRSIFIGAVNCCLHAVHSATQGTGPICFTIRTARFAIP